MKGRGRRQREGEKERAREEDWFHFQDQKFTYKIAKVR